MSRPQSIIPIGNAQISTAQSQFGGSSAVFDGNLDFLSVSHGGDLILGTNNFTFEMWFRPTARSTQYPMLLTNTAGWASNTFQLHDRHDAANTKITFWIHNFNSGSPLLTSSTSISNGTWYHLAIVRNGTSFKMYVNGTEEASATSSVNIDGSTGSTYYAGGRVSSATESYNGYIDELRISNSARYNANFTAPTTQFVNDDNTVLLIHANGANASTVFIDDNGTRNQNSIIPFGNAQISTAQNKFGGSSALFDGSGDYLRVGPNSNFNFGTSQDFTVELWVNMSSVNNTRIFWTLFDGTTQRAVLYTTSGQLSLFAPSLGGQSLGDFPSANVWHHLALSRSGNTTKVFFNGTETYSTTTSWTASSDRLALGTDNESTVANPYHGYIDEVRVSNVARYTTGFTPSTTQFVNDINTLLLVHADGTNASTNFVDDNGVRSLKGISAIGNAQISTSQSKFGGSSYSGNGDNGNYLEITEVSNFVFGSNNFTIEFWIRFNSLATQTNILDTRPGVNGAYPLIYMLNSVIHWYVNSANRITSSTISVNTWYHVAVSRNSGISELFLDGVSQGTYSDSAISYDSGSMKIAASANPLGERSLNGYIDEVRISNIARYTANFTPSTQQFVNDPNTLLLIHADGANASTAFFDDNSGLAGEILEAEAALSSSVSLSADAIRFRSTRIDMGYYFDPGYIDADYYYENPSVFSLSAELTEVVGEIVEANGAFTSSFAQTAIVGKIQSAVVDVGALFSPSFTVNAIRNSFAVLDNVFTIDTTAVANRSITQTLENIANLDAQAARFVGVSSDISAQSSVTAEVDAFKTATASLDSNSTVETTALRFRTSQADLNSELTLTALADKVQDSQADLSSEFTQTTTVGIVKQFSIDAGSLFTPQVDVNVSVNALANIEATVTVSAQAQVTRNLSSDIVANAAVSATAEVIRLLESTISSEFAQSASAERFRTSLVTLSSAFDQSATVTRIQPAASDLNSEFAQSASVARTRDDSAIISSEFAQSTVVARTRNLDSTQSSNFLQSVTVVKIHPGVANLTSTSMLVADAVKDTDVLVSATAAFAQTTQAVKTVDSTVNAGALFTPNVDINAQFAGFALLESSFTTTALIGKIIEFEPNVLNGVAADADLGGSATYQYQPPAPPGWFPNVGFVSSIWAQVDSSSPIRGALWSTLTATSSGGSLAVVLRLQYNGTAIQFVYSAPNASVQTASWANARPTDGEWHNYVIRLVRTYPNINGSPTTDWELYVDGVSKGQRTTSDFFIGSGYPTFPAISDNDGKFLIRLGASTGSNNEFPSNVGSALTGGLTQLWIGKIEDRFEITRFYSNGYVELGTDGTYFGKLPQPWIYSPLQDPYTDVNWINLTGNDRFRASTIQQPDMAAVSLLTVGLIGVALFVTDMDSNFNLVSDGDRIRTGSIDVTAETGLVIDFNIQTEIVSNLISETTQITDIDRFRQGQSTLTSEFTLTGSVRFETKFESDLFSEFTILAGIGLEQQAASDLVSEFVFAATTTIIDPIRSEADLVSVSQLSATVVRIHPGISNIDSEFALAADVTVIPPIRIEADLASEFSLQANALAIVNNNSALSSEFTVTANVSVTVGAITEVQANAALEATAFKATGIAPTTLQVTAFTLTAGDVINFDPFLTLRVEQETRGLIIDPENRVISIEQETRLNIIQGY